MQASRDSRGDNHHFNRYRITPELIGDILTHEDLQSSLHHSQPRETTIRALKAFECFTSSDLRHSDVTLMFSKVTMEANLLFVLFFFNKIYLLSFFSCAVSSGINFEPFYLCCLFAVSLSSGVKQWQKAVCHETTVSCCNVQQVVIHLDELQTHNLSVTETTNSPLYLSQLQWLKQDFNIFIIKHRL